MNCFSIEGIFLVSQICKMMARKHMLNSLSVLPIANFAIAVNAQNIVVKPLGEFYRIEANPKQGFFHPFFLYISDEGVREKNC
jgi:hypothetical protein